MIPISVAAGELKRAEQIAPLLKLSNDAVLGITMGSFTKEYREGNKGGNVFWADHASSPTSLNSLGMPNSGIAPGESLLGAAVQAIQAAGKVPRMSIAGFSSEEYAWLAKMAVAMGFCEIEVNLGCPNVRDGGTQKRIASFDPELVASIVDAVYRETDHVGAGYIAVKVSPYSDPELLKQVASVLASRPHAVDKVVCSNTFPNASGYDNEGNLLIGVADGYAGLAGAAMKYIALGQVRQFRAALPEEIKVVGVGGISSGKDVRDFERAGASEVQVGTAFFQSADPSVFQRILEERAALET